MEKIEIVVTGDYYPNKRIRKLSLESRHAEIFNDFLPVLESADLAITNLECPLIDYDYASEKFGPSLRGATGTIDSLTFAGFDMVTLANNHIMDQGVEGLYSTLACLNEKKIDYVGVGKNLTEAREPLVKMVNGQKLAVFNFAENEFSNTHGDVPGANPLSLINNFNMIRQYRDQVDKIMVIVHGGNETYELPSPRFKETLRFFADSGADLVVAHHTHCVSGYEIYNQVPIFYGLGNFLFDGGESAPGQWTTGLAVRFTLFAGSIGFDLLPFYQNRGSQVGVHLMKGAEKEKFLIHLDALNEVIADDSCLELEFKRFIGTKKKQYLHFMEPYTNRWMHGLYGRKIIPSCYSKKKKRLLLNLIRCESHRDVVLNILSK